MDAVELVLFGAFQAPSDDLFYLSEESDEWKEFKRTIVEVKVIDEAKYRWKLRFVLNSITASGAAIFRGLEEDNILIQGWHITTQATYYRINADEGSNQFRFWLATNKDDYKKMITFFNMQNNNKAVKEA